MQTIDCALSSASAAPTASFEHCEDIVRNASSADLRAHWGDIAERHLTHLVRSAGELLQTRFDVPEDGSFQGRARSGRVGNLRYARFWMSRSEYEHRCEPRVATDHCVLLCVKGESRVEASGMSVSLGAGDFALIRDIRHVRVEHDRPTEQIALINPLPADVLQRWSRRPLEHRVNRGDGTSMLNRWIQDACENRGWRSPASAASLDLVVRSLLREVMLEQPVSCQPRLNRGAIEHQVAQRLQDPSLSLADLANTFSCSVRTLHRVFRGGGGDSLERFILRQRLEACAAWLRQPWERDVTSITDLALLFGFASSSHFSTAFRARFGTSPSAYRRLHLNA